MVLFGTIYTFILFFSAPVYQVVICVCVVVFVGGFLGFFVCVFLCVFFLGGGRREGRVEGGEGI